MKLLVTGAAGFIGFHTARSLLQKGHEVVGLDNLNAYYDVELKAARLRMLEQADNFRFTRTDITDRGAMQALFARERFQRVVHLAAQAGVRYSIQNPHLYVQSNIAGFLEVIEGCRAHSVEHLVYASTSSVYGANTRMPFSERQCVDHPLTLYAATKKANELMAHSYSSLYGLPTTGLRFFTVYGPWGRPDMALFRFTKNILEGLPIDVYYEGRHQRDFTYIDDVAEGVAAAVNHVAAPDRALGFRCARCRHQPRAVQDLQHRQPAARDAAASHRGASRSASAARPSGTCCRCRWATFRIRPRTSAAWRATWGTGRRTGLEQGVKHFVEWYLGYYRQKT